VAALVMDLVGMAYVAAAGFWTTKEKKKLKSRSKS
jgi:hypothetical protein